MKLISLILILLLVNLSLASCGLRHRLGGGYQPKSQEACLNYADRKAAFSARLDEQSSTLDGMMKQENARIIKTQIYKECLQGLEN